MGAWFLSCGAECGILDEGSSAAGDAHWSSVTGVVAAETSVVRSGSKSHRFDAAATRPSLAPPVPASQSVLYFRHYFRTTSVAPSSDVVLVLGTIAVANNFTLYLKTTGVIEASFGGTGAQQSAGMSADEWFGVEAQVNLSANPHTVKWRVWRSSTGWVSQTAVSRAAAADTITAYRFGQVSGGPTSAFTLYADDSVGFLGTTGDEQWSDGTSKGGAVARLLPIGDLAHSFSTGDFKDTTSTNIATSSTSVYQLLDDDDQQDVSDYVQQAVAGAGKYVSCTFGGSLPAGTPRAVGVVSTMHSSGANANEMHLRVSDDGTNWTNVWGDWSATGKDISDTTPHFLTKVLATKPSGGAWDRAAIGGMRFQWGNSDDVADIPYLDSVSLEVDVVEGTSGRVGGDPLGTMGLIGA